jgi:Immunoglobulin domain
VTSGNFGLTVNYDPAITSQPTSSTTVCVNSVVTLSVVATGQPAPTYQWKKDGSNISGATLSSYTIPAAQSSDADSYTVVVTNSCNNTESNPATVVVNNVSTNLDTSCFSTAAGAVMSVGLGSNVAVAVTGGVQLLSNNGSGVLSAGSVISLDGTPSAMFAMSSSQLAVAVGDKVKFLSGSGLSTVTTAIDMGNSSLQITSLAVMGNDVFVGYQYGLNVYRADSSSPSGYSVQQMTDVPPVAAMAVGDLVSSNAGDELVVLAGNGSNRSLLVFASSASSISDALVSQDSLGSSSALALADLDRNGSFDAVAVAGSDGVQMHLGSSLALASSTVTSSAALSIVAGQFDNNSTGDLAYVLSTGATVVASDIDSSTGAAGSSATDCYGTGVNVAKVATASVGQSTGNCNTDELAVTRTATAQVCTIRFKCGQSVSSIADSGCSSGYTSYPTAGSSNSPVLGSNTFAITLSGAANYVYAATLMQLSTAGSVPVTITLDGPCKHVFSAANSYADVVQIATITNGSGAASNRMPIPNTASLISTELRTQWLLIDGGPMFGNTMGLSNGLLIRIGEY